MNVSVLMPGFIKSYKYIEDIIQTFKTISEKEGVNFYFFAQAFDYVIKPCINKEKITYIPNEPVDKERASKLFTKIEYVDNESYKQYDFDGFDNRIYSQWLNLKRAYELSDKYMKEHYIQYDLIIRCRMDVKINEEQLTEMIKKSSKENRMYFGRGAPINDVFFLGPQLQFYKIIKLAGSYHDYLKLDKFKEMTIQHKLNWRPHNRYLHFSSESEKLLIHHISEVLDKSEYFLDKGIAEIRRN